ncbi:MAG: metallophosphoesterase [Deltaproteobacteria bacterium]|jgi:Icc-related predicted phosphoesterase|nr:metallophosphoesterase [Deltaproteobacteria bacterium]
MHEGTSTEVLIASVSDLHTDFAENRDDVVKLALAIHERRADLVIIAGDVSHKNERIQRVLQAFAETVPRVAYLPGNHDLWFDVPDAKSQPQLDTWVRYRQELRALSESAGAHYLPAAPLYLGSTAVVGSCGWYDYSLMPASLRASVDPSVLESKQYGGLQWSDARFIAFRDRAGALMSDEGVARVMEEELRAQLAEADQRPEVQQIVAVTHHQPFYEVVTRTGTLPWEYFNAFMGSVGLGEVIRSSDKVRWAIYGHTHQVGRYQLGPITAYGTPLGYPRERRGLDAEALLKSRIGWIEL